MPNLQSTPPATGVPVLADAAALRADEAGDYALGCECADPALQIERWCQEAAPPVASGAAH